VLRRGLDDVWARGRCLEKRASSKQPMTYPDYLELGLIFAQALRRGLRTHWCSHPSWRADREMRVNQSVSVDLRVEPSSEIPTPPP